MSRLALFDRIAIAVALIAGVLSGLLTAFSASSLLIFVVSVVSLGALASVMGTATEQIGERLGPGATGVLQAALGNLPELFFGIFALRAGLVEVVQAALIGSILGNSVLVLGFAILIGGLRNGTQYFNAATPRMIATLTVLAIAALTVPTLAHLLHGPVSEHVDALSVASAIILLIVFAASISVSIAGSPAAVSAPADADLGSHWPLWLSGGILGVAALGSAFVSDWFVEALHPAIHTLHISDAFAGLVIVALAGNAVEHVVGVQLAAKNKPDYALSVILNSSLQVALGLIPILVLLSFVISGTHLTLVLPPLLLAALVLSAGLGALIVYDGESIWLEGVVLIGLYGIIAAAFWWG